MADDVRVDSYDGTIERMAIAIHRAWSLHTIVRPSEAPDEAHPRRWAEMPAKTRAEFRALAVAAYEALDG